MFGAAVISGGFVSLPAGDVSMGKCTWLVADRTRHMIMKCTGFSLAYEPPLKQKSPTRRNGKIVQLNNNEKKCNKMHRLLVLKYKTERDRRRWRVTWAARRERCKRIVFEFMKNAVAAHRNVCKQTNLSIWFSAAQLPLHSRNPYARYLVRIRRNSEFGWLLSFCGIGIAWNTHLHSNLKHHIRVEFHRRCAEFKREIVCS